MQESKIESGPFSKLLYHLKFYERHKTAIWFYGILVVIVGLGLIPWVTGVLTILNWFLI